MADQTPPRLELASAHAQLVADTPAHIPTTQWMTSIQHHVRGSHIHHGDHDQATRITTWLAADTTTPLVLGTTARGDSQLTLTRDGDTVHAQEDDQVARFRVARAHLNTQGWACDARGDYCPDHTHTPCCSAHGKSMSCATYRRTHFVEIRPCCWVDARQIAAQEAARA
ncbi:hypothetical protein SUDANB95_05491 [Actinosynnema sp. ALI-1.44]